MTVKLQINYKFSRFCSSIVLFLILLSFNFPAAVFAESSLPNLMVGQTEINQKSADGSTKMYFGGFTGNEVIYNKSNDLTAGFQYNLTARQGLANCIGADLKNVTSCFFFDLSPFSNAVKMMRSRTSINGTDHLEFVSLFYGSKLIHGDAYSGQNDLNNFSFWGKSVAQSKGNIAGSDAPFKISGYELNGESESAWLDQNGDQTKSMESFSAKLSQLYSNGTTISDTTLAQFSADNSNMNLYLQAQKDEIIKDIYEKDSALYPDGKVWSVNKDFIVGSNKTIVYHGVGTIVIKGNSVLGQNTNFIPGDEKVDHLGIMVIDE